MPRTREKSAAQAAPETPAAVPVIAVIAEKDDCRIQAPVDETPADPIEKRKQARPRVMAAYRGSHEAYGELYKKLAE